MNMRVTVSRWEGLVDEVGCILNESIERLTQSTKSILRLTGHEPHEDSQEDTDDHDGDDDRDRHHDAGCCFTILSNRSKVGLGIVVCILECMTTACMRRKMLLVAVSRHDFDSVTLICNDSKTTVITFVIS
jgi:hypothetical protein